MNVEVVFLQDFVHNHLTAAQGKRMSLEKNMATDLERAGLLRITTAPVVQPSPTANTAGKAPDAGAGQPASASPAARASQPKTSTLYVGGKTKDRSAT